MLKIFLALIRNYLPLQKLKINSLLCSYTMRVFRLTENKPINMYMSNVGSKKNLFSLRRHCCGMPQISLISTNIFTIRDKSAILIRHQYSALYDSVILPTSRKFQKNERLPCIGYHKIV